MNKFKKILLGTLSVLTLGLFVVTGARVDAAQMVEECTFDNSISNTFFASSGASYKNNGYEGISILPSNYNSSTETYNTVSYSKGLKMQTAVTFSIDHDWTAKLLIVNRESKEKNFAIKLNGETYWSKENVQVNELNIVEITGEKGDISILGAASICLYEMYVSYDASTTEETVTALQQEAVVGDYTLVRFIFIISNATDIDSYDFTDALALCLDAEKTDGPVVHRTPNVYTKLTSNGKTYSAEVKGNQYTFDNSVNENDVYVVYIVKFTTAKYLEHNISADLEYKTVTYSTTPYTFE